MCCHKNFGESASDVQELSQIVDLINVYSWNMAPSGVTYFGNAIESGDARVYTLVNFQIAFY